MDRPVGKLKCSGSLSPVSCICFRRRTANANCALSCSTLQYDAGWLGLPVGIGAILSPMVSGVALRQQRSKPSLQTARPIFCTLRQAQGRRFPPQTRATAKLGFENTRRSESRSWGDDLGSVLNERYGPNYSPFQPHPSNVYRINLQFYGLCFWFAVNWRQGWRNSRQERCFRRP